MNALVKHIEKMNAKTQIWIDEDPSNRFGGMLVSDPKHWAEYGVTTPAQLDRYLDETTLYEMVSSCTSKSYARTVVAKTDNMSDAEFKKEMDYWSKENEEHFAREKEQEEMAIKEFEERVTDMISSGAGNRETALRWIMQAENMEDESDAGYICYSLHIPYSYQKEFEPLIKRVA